MSNYGQAGVIPVSTSQTPGEDILTPPTADQIALFAVVVQGVYQLWAKDSTGSATVLKSNNVVVVKS